MLQFGKSNTYTVGAHIHMAMHQARHWYHLDPNSSCASTQLASLLRSAWQGARLSPRPPLALPPLLPPALGRLSAASSLPALFLPPPPRPRRHAPWPRSSCPVSAFCAVAASAHSPRCRHPHRHYHRCRQHADHRSRPSLVETNTRRGVRDRKGG